MMSRNHRRSVWFVVKVCADEMRRSPRKAARSEWLPRAHDNPGASQGSARAVPGQQRIHSGSRRDLMYRRMLYQAEWLRRNWIEKTRKGHML